MLSLVGTDYCGVNILLEEILEKYLHIHFLLSY